MVLVERVVGQRFQRFAVSILAFGSFSLECPENMSAGVVEYPIPNMNIVSGHYSYTLSSSHKVELPDTLYGTPFLLSLVHS